MKGKELQQALGIIDSAGLRLFTPKELQNFNAKLKSTIQTGISRKNEEPLQTGEISAFPTSIIPIRPHDIDLIPPGVKVITCACGGTNWMFAVATSGENGELIQSEPFIRPIPKAERTHTFESLIELIAGEIMNVVSEFQIDTNESIPIAISLGFPQTTLRLPNGDMDARLSTSTLPKFWSITDLDESLPPEDQPSLANLLRDNLLSKGLGTIEPIVFVNDTVAVALDVKHCAANETILPAGFVFGTGINAAMDSGNAEKGIVNLEAGHVPLIPKDDVLAEMEYRQFVPTSDGDIEFWVGGAYIPARVCGAIAQLYGIFTDPEQLIDTLMQSTNQAIISDIASDISPRQLGLHIGPREYMVLRTLAQRALQQAGQLMAVMVAAVAAETDTTSPYLCAPYEGSLLHKGYQVQETMETTLKKLLPQQTLSLYKASGISGVAKLAMCKAVVRGYL